jgi:addiction module RelE/StbE family toxin
MVQIRWTRQSIKDLSDIFEYISIDSKKYAKRQIVRIKARPKILKTNPKAGRIVPELPESGFRELVEGNYRIIYKILNERRVDILTIHHSARDLSRRKI